MALEEMQTEWERRFVEIRTEEQARNYMENLVQELKDARELCDVLVPHDEVQQAIDQRKAWRRFTIKYGQAIGAVTTFAHVRLLDQAAYNAFTADIQAVLTPTIVGVVQ